MLKPGSQLDAKTQLKSRIGVGGQGEVWLAEDLGLRRDVAVKILPATDPWQQADATAQEVRAWREAQAVARLLHPAIAAVYHVGIWRGRPYLVMEWVEGETLRARLGQGEITYALAGHWLRSIGQAVQHAHEHGVIHCDLKPENILIRPNTQGISAVKLIDFGLARGAGLRHRSPVQIRGTAAYLPPEAGQGPPTPAGDQFALAVIATELLGGRRPDVTGERAVTLPAAVASAGGGVSAVLRRALARRPEDRYADVASFIDALSAQLPAMPSAHSSSRLRPVRRRRSGGLSRGAVTALSADDLAALPRATAELLVLAMSGWVQRDELLDRAFGGTTLDAVRGRLLANGILHDKQSCLRPAVASLALDAVETLPSTLVLRANMAIAQGLERGHLGLSWVAEEAAAAWLRAGRPLAAARCLSALAEQRGSARERSKLLERAATLSAGGLDPLIHSESCVRWGLAAAFAGLRRDAERALGDALGALQISGLGLDGDGWSLRASIRELRGDAESAAEAWQSAVDSEPSLEVYARACVGRARALLRADLPAVTAALASQQAADAAAHPLISVSALITTGVALERAGQPGEALAVLRGAAADALCLGEPISAAGALVTLGEALRRTGQPAMARLQVEEAVDALGDQGTVAVAVSLALLRGRVAFDEGNYWRAWGDAQRAITLAETLALRPQETAGWRLAQEAAEAAQLPAEAHLAKLRLANLRRRASRPPVGDADWWVEGVGS